MLDGHRILNIHSTIHRSARMESRKFLDLSSKYKTVKTTVSLTLKLICCCFKIYIAPFLSLEAQKLTRKKELRN